MGLSHYSLIGAAPGQCSCQFLPNPFDYPVRIHVLAWEEEKDPSPNYPALFKEKLLVDSGVKTA